MIWTVTISVFFVEFRWVFLTISVFVGQNEVLPVFVKFKKLNFRWKQKWPLSTRRNPSPTPQLNPKFPLRRPNNLGKTIWKKSFKDIFHHSRSTSEILFPLNHMILIFFYCTFPWPFQKSLFAKSSCTSFH